MDRPLARLLTAHALLVLAVTLGACAVNPVTGKRELSLVSADQELAIGKEGYTATMAEYGVLEDARLAAYVDSVGQQLAKRSELPQLKWHFTVLDDPTVNAFAMPGGYIYITRGILAHLQSEAQLAGVLGHEIGHVTARHSARHITQQQLAGLGLGLASVISEDFRRYGAAAEQALGLLLLKYGRDDENQADALGVRYSTSATYDPREIPSTYSMLRRISERAGQRLPSFLSTHPDPGDREVRTAALAREAAAGQTGLQIRQRVFLERLRGIAFGEDPRHGYFEEARFFHPTMGFELSFPAGWKTQNSRQAVAAQSADQKAVMQLSLASDAKSLGPAEYVAALQRDGRIGSATGRSESIGGWSAWTGRLALPAANGGTTTLAAAFVRQAPDRLFQFIAQVPDEATERIVLQSVRSLRPLADAARTRAMPSRLELVPAPRAGTFESLYPGLGPSELDMAAAAILNGVEPDEAIQAGVWIKVARPSQRR